MLALLIHAESERYAISARRVVEVVPMVPLRQVPAAHAALRGMLEYRGQTIPVILFTKGAGELLGDMVETGCDALGVDWTTDLADPRRYTADRVALQGNLDPAILRESPEAIRDGVARVLESYGNGPGHVFNLGHGITPDIDPDHLGVLVDAVHELSPQYHD